MFPQLKEIYKEYIPTDTLILYSRQLRHGSAKKSVFNAVVFVPELKLQIWNLTSL